MSEIIVNMQGYGNFKLTLDLHDPGDTEVWKAVFTESESDDAQVVYFEMPDTDYEAWDLIDIAIQTYRDEIDLS